MKTESLSLFCLLTILGLSSPCASRLQAAEPGASSEAVPVVPAATDAPIPKSTFDDSETTLDPFFPESKRRITEVPQPKPVVTRRTTASDFASVLVLNGMSGAANNRLVLINGKTLAQGESTDIDTDDDLTTDEDRLHVTCQEIKKTSVIVIVGKDKIPVELTLKE